MQHLASAHDLRTTSRLFMGLGLYWHPAAGEFGGGGGGAGPHTGRDCRPVRPSLRSTGPKSRRSGSKAERTGTAPWTTPQLRRAEDAVTGPVGGGGGCVSGAPGPGGKAGEA